MARTAQQILAALVDSVRLSNPTVDTKKGPVFFGMLLPVPQILADNEAIAERVAVLSTLQIDSVISTDEIAALQRTFGIQSVRGKAASGSKGCYYKYSPPTRDIKIDAGSMASTAEGQFSYYTTRSINIPVTSAQAYYVASRRRYEFIVPYQATAIGTDYEVAEQRINRMVTKIDGMDGFVNLDSPKGSFIDQDPSVTLEQIRIKMTGISPDSGGSIIDNVYAQDPSNVLNVVTVFPKDHDIFTRMVTSPAIDVYVYGLKTDTDTYTITAIGGEQDVVLPKPPVISVESVRVNNNSVPFSLSVDRSTDTGLSAAAHDRIVLVTPLSANDVLTIDYTYNALIRGLQDDLFSVLATDDAIRFGTDVLARQYRTMDLSISVDVRLSGAQNDAALARTAQTVRDVLSATVETGRFGERLSPTVLEQQLEQFIGRAASVRFRRFTRLSGGTADVETVVARRNEVPMIVPDLLKVFVR